MSGRAHENLHEYQDTDLRIDIYLVLRFDNTSESSRLPSTSQGRAARSGPNRPLDDAVAAAIIYPSTAVAAATIYPSTAVVAATIYPSAAVAAASLYLSATVAAVISLVSLRFKKA